MAKIERVASSVFSSYAVTRKDSAEDTNDQKKRDGQDQNDQRKKADRESVDKAIKDLQSAPTFTQTGIRVEVLDGKDGIRVRLAHGNGMTIRTMTAEEFLKLRDASAGDGRPRGKILDQKL